MLVSSGAMMANNHEGVWHGEEPMMDARITATQGFCGEDDVRREELLGV
jgi:hypothetical protein